MKISILSAGKDRPYALGIAEALVQKRVEFDFVGNSEFEKEEIFSSPFVNYYNLRGEQGTDASAFRKIARVLLYYWKLIRYAAKSDVDIFHILWLNKFIVFDSTLLNAFYKLTGKKLVYTAHNINIKERDGGDNIINRLSLKFLYYIVDHIFVHTQLMKDDLIKQFHVQEDKVTVIPFGLNSTVPETSIDRSNAREHLGLKNDDIVLLFFGNIAPYKGLDILVESLNKIKENNKRIKLIIAGRIKGENAHWEKITQIIAESGLEENIIRRIEFIPENEVEIYFKASDALVLPYRFIYQSGPLFLAYNFGLPVIANNTGSFKEDIVEGDTGFVSKGTDSDNLAEAIEIFIKSPLIENVEYNRQNIKKFAKTKYSWDAVVDITLGIYRKVFRRK